MLGQFANVKGLCMARWELVFEIDRTGGTSYVRQIAKALSEEIQRGRLRPGNRLPGTRTLARTLHVHRQTVVAAVEELIAEGWLVSRQASGTFVAAGLPEPSSRRSSFPVRARSRAASEFAIALPAAPVPELPRVVPSGTILMSGTRPDLRLLSVDLIARAYRRALRTGGPSLLSYSDPAGVSRLRHALATMLSATRGLAVEPNSIIVTRGSQMALALTARAMLRPGDAVAVENPGYRPAWEAFRGAGAEVIPVRVDEHGIDVAALERLLTRQSITAVYVTPHHQYPTTVTLTGPRRAMLLQLAVRERVAVIEDDYDHEFHYRGRPVLPMASVDAEGVVIYIGTLSKVLAPGLRLGFVAAPPNLIARLIAHRSFIDLHGDPVLESAIAELLDEGLIQRHVRKMRRVYQRRLEILASALRQLGDFVRYRVPSGGTAIWVKTKDSQTMMRWSEASRANRVAFDPPSDYNVSPIQATGARLGFASLTEDELRQAVNRLASAATVTQGLRARKRTR
ncbi:MAG TPA: PLP-dependent aminotransferase family protein [Vicinamibacterales bacterium]|nr:PLP-dependent aminotransferase family protein [Vicinamibacterales bacterium]